MVDKFIVRMKTTTKPIEVLTIKEEESVPQIKLKTVQNLHKKVKNLSEMTPSIKTDQIDMETL